YPENGVVEMPPVNVRPRARTLLRWDQLSAGLRVMVNYNMETPEERGSGSTPRCRRSTRRRRTCKELRVNILLGVSGDVIADCKVHFLDEVYQVEGPGARPLSAADGQFKRYCPTCKNDTSEVIKAGEKLKASKKKARMPSATTESQRDWGKGMACVGRTKECTIVPSNHYGPVPGVPVGTTWKFRVQLSLHQRQLVHEDAANRKLWDEALVSLAEGPNFLCKVEQSFMCVCCQELAYHPITTTCLQRSFRAEVYTCPACRHDLGKDYAMNPNKTLQVLLDQFFPGYSKGR
ncbi:hypothetical protein CRUP_029144, partial [Coryphaenoides rupestris]